MSLITQNRNLRFDVPGCRLSEILAFSAIAALLSTAPWFHGLTGLADQLAAESAVFSVFLILQLFPNKLSPSGFRPAVHPLDQLLVWALLVTGFYTAVSVLPFYSLMTWIRFLSVVAVYAIARTALTHERAQYLVLLGFVLMGLFYSCYGLLQYYGGYFPKDYWYSSSSLASRYVNSGHFAGLLVLPIFAAALLLMLTHKIMARGFYAGALLFLGATLLLTRSRTVWISLAAGGAGLVLLLVRLRVFSKRWFLGMAVFTLAALAGAHAAGLTHTVIRRFSEIWDGHTANFFSIVHRFHFWEGAVQAILARPWGWGLGTFVHIFPRFRVHADRFIVDYAHNETLQLGVDLGIPGLIAVASIFAAYVCISVRFLKQTGVPKETKTGVAGVFMCMLTLVLASQFDFPLRIYATALLTAVLLAYQASLMKEVKTSVPGRLSALFGFRPVWAVLVFLGGLLALQNFLAESALRQGIKFEKIFEWDAAMQQYMKASRLVAWQSDYVEAAARLAEKRAALSFDTERRKNGERQALALYETSTRLHPYWPASFFRAGRLHQTLGNDKAAEMALRRAHQNEPQNALYLSEYAFFCLHHDRVPEAIHLLETLARSRFQEKVQKTAGQILEEVYPYVKETGELERIIPAGWGQTYALGLFLGKQGRWPEGVLEMQKALKEAKAGMELDYFMKHLGLGTAQIYLEQGFYEPAQAIYEEALQHDPTNETYRRKIHEISALRKAG